ncbi:neurogenic locus notch homolog protein 3 [Venturia canescens]|uniref:neurogenic locus notch homolog protein 3 n=1 Tax=Venturia canescens TaxID=32260 RepID=UPI001C9C8CF4|nr:neurogenic locus notch homolog protein 3 [Venturia canescens]XP_043283208.1 neurogenic locus notch homolog protein 3 [Venturia canescens]XP_043283216.1 neurogenic locus notch homolog protein 3 [Venturia canescens]
MRVLQTVVLLVAALAGSITFADASYYYSGRVVNYGGCASQRCGTNAKCSMSEGRPVCSCLNLHMGDPLVSCHRVECQINEDCPSTRVCSPSNTCVDPCIGLCGTNARCEVNQHIANCACAPGYVGDPFTHCHVEDPQAACKPSPCGVNTKCEVVDRVAVCSCLPGYLGSPLAGCRHECESDSECSAHLSCSPNFRCESPCNKCGEGANCDVVNHQPKCSCPRNWLGNPYTRCHPECTHHSECSGSKPACLYQKCVNPCEGACGINANCELRDITPVCSCPRHMTGDPFISCRPFEPADLCKPNPCGENAICTPGHDNTGKERPVCTCPTGYTGNALSFCRRGECQVDSECPDNRACIDYFCQNPCTGKECASSAKCEARQHIAVCTCLDGTRGDAIYGCNRIESAYRNYRTYNRG